MKLNAVVLQPPTSAVCEGQRLSSREIEIMEKLACGLSDKETAPALQIARTTVNDHLKSIYRKLGVHSRAHAVARYLKS